MKKKSFLSWVLSVGFVLPASLGWSQTAEIIIQCKNDLGDASRIEDFLGAGGGLYYVSTDPNDPIVQAWKKIGFKHITFETLHVEDPTDHFITVSRDANGQIQIDFTDYDKYVASYIQNLGAEPFVYLGNVPRVLSSHPEDPHYAVYMPKDLNEWESFVSSIVRHNLEKFGLSGIYYAAMGEPDHIDSWKGNGGGDFFQRLREHIRLYASTYRAVKAVDPSARVGGPATMNWQTTKYTEIDYSRSVLKDWLRELAKYNFTLSPQNKVGLDYISWQDYAWSSDDVAEAANAVSGFLAENGFDPDTPKVLGGSGWGSWSSDYLNTDLQPFQRASHAAYNLIREFKDPGQRKFALALYYPFYYRDEWRVPGQPEDDLYTQAVALVNVSSDGSLYLTPMYATFQMAHAMAHGQVVETYSSEPLEAMAVRQDDNKTVIAVINNHSADAVVTNVTFKDFPFEAKPLRRGFRRIDEQNSVDGTGLQEAVWDKINFTGQLGFSLTLAPYSTVQITLSGKSA